VDDAALIKKGAPLAFRILWGFLDREGLREGEAIGLRVRDFDLERGTVSLDENKTDDPRTWALDPGVKRALAAWVKLRAAGTDDNMFVDEHGGILTDEHRYAVMLRAHLQAAGVTRHELHHSGTNRGKMRVHDLRGTFVTLSLANGKTETWVSDRTGHKSSQMINRYRRSARSASELGLGELKPLDQAIPEFRPAPEQVAATAPAQPNADVLSREPATEQPETTVAVPEPAVNSAPLGADGPAMAPKLGTPEGTRTPDRWIRNPLL